MPNWCINKLVLEGPKEDIERFMAKSSTVPDYYYLNFASNKFICLTRAKNILHDWLTLITPGKRTCPY